MEPASLAGFNTELAWRVGSEDTSYTCDSLQLGGAVSTRGGRRSTLKAHARRESQSEIHKRKFRPEKGEVLPPEHKYMLGTIVNFERGLMA